MPTTDHTMQQITRMVQAGWSVQFYPSTDRPGVITMRKPGEKTLWDEIENDIPAAWARLVAMWERVVGDA